MCAFIDTTILGSVQVASVEHESFYSGATLEHAGCYS